jgi:exopolysaccharide biosynthesis protein
MIKRSHIATLTFQLLFHGIFIIVIGSFSRDGDYVLIPSDKGSSDQQFFLQKTKLTFQPPVGPEISVLNGDKDVDATQQQVQLLEGYLAVAKGAAPKFRILTKDSQCSLHKTSSFAKNHDCVYAINGGPFQSYITGGCISLVISNGKVIHSGFQYYDNMTVVEQEVDSSYIGFGVSYDNEWILGNIITDDGNLKVQVKEFVSGLSGWLIRDEKIIPSINEESDVYAPRSAIGVNSEGNLIIFQVDGCERCAYHDKQRKGLTLYQMALIMASPPINAVYAINLDGGGSSTSVADGKVINHPTCFDYVDWECERPVGSIVCIEDDNIGLLELTRRK